MKINKKKSFIALASLTVLIGFALLISCNIDTDSDENSGDRAVKKSGSANLTWFESYPDPNSEECEEYNGCTWAGQFAFVSGKKSESWVKSHNIIAVHSKHANTYKLKTFRITQGSRKIDAVVYDMCSDSDCGGCCTANLGKEGFLIDMEKYTLKRFGGSGSGSVKWECLDCK